MKKTLLFLIAFVLLFGGFTALNYNTLVSLEEDVHNKWSILEANYQKRADLIPSFVSNAKHITKQESEVFSNIADLAVLYTSASTPEAYALIDLELKEAINLTLEIYPELNLDDNILNIQDELEGSENRIAIARKDYNDSVATFNKQIRRFPSNIFASAFGFERTEFFESIQRSEQSFSLC